MRWGAKEGLTPCVPEELAAADVDDLGEEADGQGGGVAQDGLVVRRVPGELEVGLGGLGAGGGAWA